MKPGIASNIGSACSLGSDVIEQLVASLSRVWIWIPSTREYPLIFEQAELGLNSQV